MRICDYAAKPFCAVSYFLGAATTKSPVKQHSDTNHSANVGQGSAGTFRSSAEVSRSVTASAVHSRSGLASPTTIPEKLKTPDGFVDSRRFDSVCVCVGNAFSKPLQAIPKPDLSAFVLDLMIYLISYELCLMSYRMSYDILSSYDLTTLVYVLLLGLRLTILKLVLMHFVLCRSLRILEDMSFLSFSRILILLCHFHT